MKVQSVTKTFLCLILAIVFSSCVTTERFATYSKTTIGGLKMSDEINYSFRKHCISNSTYLQNQNIISGEPVSLDTSDCRSSKATDDLMAKVYTTLLSYFNGMQKLSAGQNTDYSVEGITSTFKVGNYTGINLSENQVKSINSIGQILISASTGAYRNEKIKEFIIESDKPVSNLLEIYSTYYELLKLNVQNEKLGYKKQYATIVNNKTGKFSLFDKMAALTNYTASFNKLENQRLQIDLMIKALEQIKGGHNQLAAKVNTLSKSDLKNLLMKSSSNIFQLTNEFKSL